MNRFFALFFVLFVSVMVNLFIVFQLRVEKNKNHLLGQRVASLELFEKRSLKKKSEKEKLIEVQANEINHLKMEMEESSLLVRQSGKNLEKLKKEYDKMEKNLNDQLSRFESDQKRWDQEKLLYESQIKEATSDDFTHQILKRKAQLEIRLDDVLSRLDDEKGHFKEKEKVYRHQLQQLEKQLSVEKLESPYSKEKFSQLNLEVERLNSLVETHSRREEQLRDDLFEKEKVVDKLAEDLSFYKKRIDGKEEWFSNLEKKYNVAINTLEMVEKTIEDQGQTIQILQEGISRQSDLIHQKDEVIVSLKKDIIDYLKTVDDKKEGLFFLSDKMRQHIRDFERLEDDYKQDILEQSELYLVDREKIPEKPEYQGHIFKDDVSENRQIKGKVLEIDVDQSVVFADIGGRQSVQPGCSFYILKKGRKIAEAQPFIIRDHMTAFNYVYLEASYQEMIEQGDLIVS